jgi:hypothetical protein
MKSRGEFAVFDATAIAEAMGGSPKAENPARREIAAAAPIPII